MPRIQPHRRRHGAALLALSALLAFAPCALASDPGSPGPTADGWRKVLAYSGCALQVFAAVSVTQWAGAVILCGRLFLDEKPLTGGGQ